MSGYLEVKYPFKSNLGLNPFKSWKRQWCILRPSPTSAGGGSLAVYCSEAGSPTWTVQLHTGCIVKREKSRTRPHAFAVFSIEEPCKPRILLAAQSLQEAQQWMGKIRDLLNGDKLLGTESLLKDSYSMTVIPTEVSRKSDNNVALSSGLMASQPQSSMVLRWQHVTDVFQTRENGDKNKTCLLSVDSGLGGGEMKCAGQRASAPRSRSQPDLAAPRHDTGELRRSSWYSGPSEVSLDDTDLIMSKEARRIPSGQLARSRARRLLRASLAELASFDDGSCSRRSVVSVSSGVYEEIAEEAAPREEHTYEAVPCVYATWRRQHKRHPPPLPPRAPLL